MHRRIVVLRPHEWLGAAASGRSFSVAAQPLEQMVAVKGMTFDQSFHPVALQSRLGPSEAHPVASGFNYGEARPLLAYCLRTDFEDEEAVARLRHDRPAEVVGVYADPAVEAFPTPYCGAGAVGDADDVARALGVHTLRQAGLTGRRVRVAVVDTGVDGTMVSVHGGWSPDHSYQPGSSGPGHGTMCAWDACIAAPDARVLDYALLRSTGGTWTAFLSDAIAAFADLLDLLAREPGPLVVNNSWGMFDRSEDEPIGSSGNYSANLDHPFNQIVGSLVAAGADVFFAAGNCGENCPDGRCGSGDTGPGASIHGANSHPDVVTVAAVTVTDRRLGYSSQGPGGLHRRKPDLAAYSHFSGSGVYAADGGTSAASPVAAGAAAALRQRLSPTKYAPAQLKGLLQHTARDVGLGGWDFDFGYGAIDAAAALRAALPTPKKAKAKKAPRGKAKAGKKAGKTAKPRKKKAGAKKRR
jgi:subtilisin family serine protease